MLRIDAIEALGARAAAISGIAEGDCGAGAPDGRGRFLASLGLDDHRVVPVRQVHGAAVTHAPPPPAPETEADAVLVHARGWCALVSVADCAPIWLYDPDRAIGGVVHAGRAGTFAGVAAAAVRAFPEARALHAWIGPSAGPCCYEVSEVIARQADTSGVPRQGRLLDLWEANRRQLREAGVPAGRIGCSAHCTICGGGFHSHRAHGTPARNAAVLAL